jgi:toxin-antitoxin system PIN domain toxin
MLIDANLLLYAAIRHFSQHAAVQAWLDHHLNTGPKVGVPWPSVLAFVRLATNPRIFERPLSLDAAWTQVEQWLAVPLVWIPEPTARHTQVLGPLLRVPGLQANDVPDAHLAALAIAHDLTLYSADRGFARFPGLRWENPLAPSPRSTPRRKRGNC